MRPAVVSGNKKGGNRAKILLGLQTHTNSDVIQGEPAYVESCEGQQQQLVVCLSVGKAHAQLRRLRNESSILDDAVITAIPPYKSRVLFTLAKVRPIQRGLEYYMQPGTTPEVLVSSNDYQLRVNFILILLTCFKDVERNRYRRQIGLHNV